MSFWARLATWLNPPDPGPIAFAPAWIAILETNLPLYRRLPAGLRNQLHDQIAHFVRHKHFETRDGLELTDEIVLTIAGQACLLALNQTGAPFPNLHSIVVHPSTYRATESCTDATGLVHRREVLRLGESWAHGKVVLAWDAVCRGARDSSDGHNVVLHEFAHQLDQADGRSDGTPHLPDPARYRQWTDLMVAGHAQLARLAAQSHRSVLHPYGATNLAEFFAVATEAFFEKPRQLADREPVLYAELAAYYRLHPLDWFESS